MDTDTILVFVVGPLMVVFVVAASWWFDRRSKIILKKWADENGFDIVEKRQRYMFFTGPFRFWTNGRNQVVYFLRIRDRGGHERSGWARCGAYFGGVFFSNKIEIRWDETHVA
jgi:hypothetical protein